MTSPAVARDTRTELDEQTRRELTPPCEVGWPVRPCRDPAAWIVWFTGPGADDENARYLACDPHKRTAERHCAQSATCWCHGESVAFHAEPLR